MSIDLSIGATIAECSRIFVTFDDFHLSICLKSDLLLLTKEYAIINSLILSSVEVQMYRQYTYKVHEVIRFSLSQCHFLIASGNFQSDLFFISYLSNVFGCKTTRLDFNYSKIRG